MGLSKTINYLHPLWFQMRAAVSLWTQVPVGSTQSSGTTTQKPTAVPSSGMEVVRATQTTLRLKPIAGLRVSTRNRTFDQKGVCKVNTLSAPPRNWADRWHRLYWAARAHVSSRCYGLTLYTAAGEGGDGALPLWLHSHCRQNVIIILFVLLFWCPQAKLLLSLIPLYSRLE